MKKYITFALLSLIVAPAQALTPYLSTGITSGIQNSGKHASTSYNTLWTLNAGVQYALNDNISMRNGIEYAMSDYTFKNTAGGIDYEYDTKTKIYMGNIVAEFHPTGFQSSIYAGVSAGITNYTTELKHPYVAPTTEHSTFTYGASAGVSINIIAGLYADVGVRYLTTADAGGDGNLITTGSLHMGF